MKRLILVIGLTGGLLGFVWLNADAQTKKDAVPAKLGEVEIFKGKAGFRWRVVDTDGKTIAMPPASKAWETKEEVGKALDELKETLNKVKPKEVKE